MNEETKAQIMLLYRRGGSPKSIALQLEESHEEVRSYILSMTVGLGKKTRRPIKKQKIVVPFEVPEYAPICNATATETYKPTELNYRGKQ